QLQPTHNQDPPRQQLDEPTPHIAFTKYISGKVTYASLVEHLGGFNKNLTMQREEGKSFLQTDLFKNDTDALTQLWSGFPPLDRMVRGKEVRAVEARCSVGFRIQPVFMEEYLRKQGKLSYKLGFWPRAIAGCHDPERFPENSICQVPGWDCSPEQFQLQLKTIAARLDKRKFTHRVLVKLSMEAKAFMLELEHILAGWKGTEYPDIQEAVGTAWENTLRVATVLHVFCTGYGTVSREFTERAWKIVQWSLYQHQLIFVESLRTSSPYSPHDLTVSPPYKPYRFPKAPKTPRPMENATLVLDCLHKLFDSDRDLIAFPLDDLRVLTGLNARLFATAMAWLELDNQVCRFEDRGRSYIRFNQAYLDRRYHSVI
ncbi:MAG: DUF3987 domain-containing protein, partial [Verrucomicrobiaceae bacterium]